MVAFPVSTLRPGHPIPLRDGSLQVIRVVEPVRDEDLPVLVVERSDPNRQALRSA
jgi:hypothetical protein